MEDEYVIKYEDKQNNRANVNIDSVMAENSKTVKDHKGKEDVLDTTNNIYF